MTSPSPTQRRLEPSDVERLVAASFGPRREVADAGPMTGGGFAAVWWVTLGGGEIGGGEIGGGETVVLKVAPAADVPLLSYERALLAAEAHYYRLVERCAPEVPLPTVLRYGSDPGVLDSDWMFMTRLAGRSLSELRADQPPADQPPADDTPVRRDLGAALASLHAVTGPRFGYDGGRVSGPNWRRVFAEMIDELLSDARSWQVELPAAPARIRESVERHAVLLDQVERPALVHFDTWDGNVLAAPSLDGGLRLTGLVDGERYLYGDPVMDLVSAALYRRIEDDPDHPVLLGYLGAAGAPLVLDESVRRRLMLYRLHLYLLMIVEMPSRGMLRKEDSDRYDRLAALLDEQLTELGRGRPE